MKNEKCGHEMIKNSQTKLSVTIELLEQSHELMVESIVGFQIGQ